jgi:hypothetical protein
MMSVAFGVIGSSTVCKLHSIELCAPKNQIVSYSSDNSSVDSDERFEQLIAFLGSQLPSPVEQHQANDGTLIFIGGAPAEVVVHLDESNVVVSEYAEVRESIGRVTSKPRRVGLLRWRRLPETQLMNAVLALIKGAREMRIARYRLCAVCGQKNPPEALSKDDVCRWCADRPREVVH